MDYKVLYETSLQMNQQQLQLNQQLQKSNEQLQSQRMPTGSSPGDICELANFAYGRLLFQLWGRRSPILLM